MSAKVEPGDVDALFVFTDESEQILAGNTDAQELINHQHIKGIGLGDIFCFKESSVRLYPELCRLDGFNFDKHTGVSKGLVEVMV